ncbi:MAG TPA: SUMF1/EgtB/PvdO family nonheme iron enzyme [Thermoguttaceae bacterium]|nr:SUMF1/EgtB/PvdO family nonheme iron enzyme [Thermoguttaceae bacterium]
MKISYTVLLTVAILCPGSPAESEPPAKKEVDAGVVRVDDHIEEADGRDSNEILGPGLGEFIFISGGEYAMGRNNGENEDERPEHLVELYSFHIGRTPVTNAQFVRFLNEMRVQPEEYPFSQVRSPIVKPSITLVDGKWTCAPGTENDAVAGESWFIAGKYCDWLSAKSGRKCRLPTEAEWEYACRGKEGRKFPWGDSEKNLESRVWCWRTWRSGKPHTLPVGNFPKGATPEGVCDLIGYMDEMCSDWYDPRYYAKSPKVNPRGPSNPMEAEKYKNAKVTRGGLEGRYQSKGAIGFFRESQFFGVLPSTYLPRGWTRKHLREATGPPKSPSHAYGRLGFRVAVEIEAVNSPVKNPGSL